MKAFSITDIGVKRQTNQDYVYSNTDTVGTFPNLFIVADGMGGHNAGDLASRFCAETFTEKIKVSAELTIIGKISTAIRETNEMLLTKASEDKTLEGMGTTFVMASIFDNLMYVANIGDSRLYLINDVLQQITEDHSLVEEMVKKGELAREDVRCHPNKNVITRALGANQNVVPDFFEVNVKSNDIILLCSDGLSNMLEDSEIFSIVKKHPDNLETVGKELAEAANMNGGKDNISIVLIKI